MRSGVLELSVEVGEKYFSAHGMAGVWVVCWYQCCLGTGTDTARVELERQQD